MAWQELCHWRKRRVMERMMMQGKLWKHWQRKQRRMKCYWSHLELSSLSRPTILLVCSLGRAKKESIRIALLFGRYASITGTETLRILISIVNGIYVLLCFWCSRNLAAKKTLSSVEFLMDMDLGDTLYLKGSGNYYLLLCCAIGRKIWLQNHLTLILRWKQQKGISMGLTYGSSPT